ncbi:MAG TPA: LysM peptidoglycan-binding domain-containing protein [Steroidobacteraceae bacterium]|nr:LysM peptidoglycan-binding domain-containing protein [Steroidobacteraceae bacterium]
MPHHESASAPEAPKVAAIARPETGPAKEPQTVTSNLPDVPADGQAATVVTETTAALSPTAPKSYVVQRGDTLWGLANKFLKDPWLWPEIWYVNPEVSNPHRIYPGDTLRLAKGTDGKEQVQVVRTSGSATRLEPLLRSTELEAPIANIPYSTIAAFLSRPGVLTKQQVEAAPYVLALRDRHLIAGTENEIYVRKLSAGLGEHFSVMHVGEKLKDPDGGRMGGKTLGYLAEYAGTAMVTRVGNPASAVITDSAREVVAGDVLVPEAGGSVADILPHVPAGAIHARVISVVHGVLLAGQYQVVAINRGSQQGIEPGHVLRANRSGDKVRDHCATVTGLGTCTGHTVKLPLEPSGTLLMFRVYDHVSFGLVLSETNPIATGDLVTTP